MSIRPALPALIVLALVLLEACGGRAIDTERAPAGAGFTATGDAGGLRNPEPVGSSGGKFDASGGSVSLGDDAASSEPIVSSDAAVVIVSADATGPTLSDPTSVDASEPIAPFDASGPSPIDAAASPSPPLTVVDPGNSTQPASTFVDGTCLCTRRDANPVGNCPRGVGQSVSATIGPEGGTLSLVGQEGGPRGGGIPFTLTIPPTALGSRIVVTLTELAAPPPDGFVDWSPVYRIDPVDAILTTPGTLSIPFSNGRGGSVFDQNIGIFWSSDTPTVLERLPSTYANAGFAQGSTSRFGYAIVGYVHAGTTPYCM